MITTPLTLPVTRAERPAPGLPDIDPLTMTIDPMHQLVICASLYRDEARQEHCQFERRIANRLSSGIAISWVRARFRGAVTLLTSLVD